MHISLDIASKKKFVFLLVLLTVDLNGIDIKVKQYDINKDKYITILNK
jgi:hypothetical protein